MLIEDNALFIVTERYFFVLFWGFCRHFEGLFVKLYNFLIFFNICLKMYCKISRNGIELTH